MKTAPSEVLQGVAEEIVEGDVNENKIIGDPNAPNKDTNTIVKVVVTGEHETTPGDLKEKSFKVHLVTNTIIKAVTGEDVTTPSEIKEEKSALKFQLVTTIILNILPGKTVQG